jgi:hypothetical protein
VVPNRGKDLCYNHWALPPKRFIPLSQVDATPTASAVCQSLSIQRVELVISAETMKWVVSCSIVDC